MNVEAVLDNGRQFDLKGIDIYRLAAGDVHLQRGRIGPGKIADGDGAQPQCAQDFLQVWGKVAVVVHRLRHRNDVVLRFFAQGAVVFVGH